MSSKSKNKLGQLFWNNIILRRFFLLSISSLSILGLAASCSTPNPFSGNQVTYGVLKRDLSVRADGFVRANGVLDLNNNLDQQGLTPLSSLKMVRSSRDVLYLLTKEKGLFKSSNAGSEWQRKYIFKVDSNSSNEERTQKLKENDALVIGDVATLPGQEKVIYVSALEKNFGKIYQSLDGGDSFKEIYTEVEPGIEVSFLTIDPVNPLRVYAVLEEGAVIRSLDAGLTWQKIRSFNDNPIQIGFIPEFDQLLYVLLEKDGLLLSADGGQTFTPQVLTKQASDIGEEQPTDSFNFGLGEPVPFGSFEKIVPVPAGIQFNYDNKTIQNPTGQQPWVLIADRQLWFTEDLKQPFKKLVLPVQLEQINIQDIVADPKAGLNRLIVSVDDKLFITRNQGETWTTQDLINLSTDIGNISQVLIEPEDTEILYLCLVNKNAVRKGGIIGF